jgi:hypothetical protein
MGTRLPVDEILSPKKETGLVLVTVTPNLVETMDDEMEHPHRRIQDLEERLERLAASGRWDDHEIQDALLAVARAHLWKQGLWQRVKFAVNVVGFLGVIGGSFTALFALLGVELVRR